MSTITRTGDNNNSPTWFDTSKTAERKAAGPARAEPFPKELDEEALVGEMDLVEKCASDGNPYLYKADWPEDSVSQLREFACACGVKTEAVSETDAEPVVPVDGSMAKTAEASAKVTPVADLGALVGDPFHLAGVVPETRTPKEIKEDRKAERMAEWHKVSPEQKMRHPDVMMASSSIITVPGGDDPMASRTVGVGRGENSVASPDAIGEFAKTEDSGERLHAAARQLRAERRTEKKLWE